MKNYNNNQPQINPNAHIIRLDAKIQRKISYQLKQCGLFEEDIQANEWKIERFRGQY